MGEVEQKVKEIKERQEQLKLGGGITSIEGQHSKGKLTARERIDKLLYSGSFQEIELQTGSVETGFDIDKEAYPADGVAVGYGKINGQPIFVWSQDATVLGGTMANVHCRKIVMVMEKALQARIPIIGMVDSEGMRAEDVIHYPQFYSPERMSYFQVISSGVIPQIILVMGPCTGELAICTQLADFVFLVRNTSYTHVSEPPEGITAEELGSSWMHARTTGCYDVFCEDDEDCLKKCRTLLSFLPANNDKKPPIIDTKDDPNRCEEELLELVPLDGNKPYSMYKLISLIADNGEFFELKRYWAQNLITGFIRLGGQTVGLIANNPQNRAGCLTLDAADKMTRLVRFCDAFNIPLLWLCDTPAFLPAVEEETRGLIRHGAKMISANSEATVPQITVVIRKAYGGGNLAMPGILLGGDLAVCWPQLDRGLMGVGGAVAILHKKELESIADETQREKQRQLRIAEISRRAAIARTESSQIHIDPRDTRPFLIKAFKTLANRKETLPARKHENFRV